MKLASKKKPAGLPADALRAVNGGCNPDFIGPQLPPGSTPRPEWGPGSGCGSGGGTGGGKGQGPS